MENGVDKVQDRIAAHELFVGRTASQIESMYGGDDFNSSLMGMKSLDTDLGHAMSSVRRTYQLQSDADRTILERVVPEFRRYQDILINRLMKLNNNVET